MLEKKGIIKINYNVLCIVANVLVFAALWFLMSDRFLYEFYQENEFLKNKIAYIFFLTSFSVAFWNVCFGIAKNICELSEDRKEKILRKLDLIWLFYFWLIGFIDLIVHAPYSVTEGPSNLPWFSIVILADGFLCMYYIKKYVKREIEQD